MSNRRVWFACVSALGLALAIGSLRLTAQQTAATVAIDNDNGTATISITRPEGAPAASVSGVLASLQFEAVGPGTASVTFSQASVADASQSPVPTSSSGTQVTVK